MVIRFQVLLCSALLIATPASADIRSPTGKPLEDFYTVHGAIGAVRAIKDICNTRFPDQKLANEKAYKAWQERYRDFRYKMEQYNEEIIKSIAKGNAEKYTKMLQDDALTYEKSKEDLHSFYLSMGEDAYRKSCKAYPSYTTSEKANFSVYYEEHMSIFEKYWRKTR